MLNNFALGFGSILLLLPLISYIIHLSRNKRLELSPATVTIPLPKTQAHSTLSAIIPLESTATIQPRPPQPQTPRVNAPPPSPQVPPDPEPEIDPTPEPEIDPTSEPTEEKPRYDKSVINEAVECSRALILDTIKEFVETKQETMGSYAPLYELLTDYPFRTGKMLRPTICLSMARAVGGLGHSALTTATALELCHNAFLIHDDIEDGSESRRGKDTLHRMVGIPRAINVGNATQVLAVGLLLDNLSVVGVTKTMNILHEIDFMAQQSVEGQAMELDWVANNAGNLTDQDYFEMCVKKTCWYTFMTPCRLGLMIGYPDAKADALKEPLAQITRFGMLLGIAFQIQDDLLNLQGTLESYGKEIAGDLYEGKRTLMLNHVIKNSKRSDRILKIMALEREDKTADQIAFVLDEMDKCKSIEHGWTVAQNTAEQAASIFDSLDFVQPETPLRPMEYGNTAVHDRRFMRELINYVIYRNK